MTGVPIGALVGALICDLLSAFFSAAEIAMVSLNRHRLRHLADHGHRGARLAARLIDRPLGVILLGNNSLNALFSALTTVSVNRLWSEKESAIGIATVVITLVILILTNLVPKTLAALHAERIAFPSVFVLRPPFRLGYPVVRAINVIAIGLLQLIGVRVQASGAYRRLFGAGGRPVSCTRFVSRAGKYKFQIEFERV